MDFVIDIDGTLADASHRLHLILGEGKKDWDAFLSEELVSQDAPKDRVWRTIAVLWTGSNHKLCGNRGLFITGRRESTRTSTRRWLLEHATKYGLYRKVSRAKLLMRPDGDRRPSHEVKRDLLRAARGFGYSPVVAFEDRADDTAMYRAEGLTVFQVEFGNY